MGRTDEFDLKKFLKEIDEAILKYKKTLEFIRDQITKVDFPLDEELEEEAEKIENTIANLELTKKVYSRDLPQKALTGKEEKPIPKDVDKEKIKTISVDAILTYPSTQDHIQEIIDNQKTDRRIATDRHKKSEKRTWTLFFAGLGVGGFIGFLASYSVAILTQQELPQIIFTNGTIIYP